MKQTDWLLCLAKNWDWFKFKIQKFKKTWIERCRHLCVCPLIDHRREPIRMRELLGLFCKAKQIHGHTKTTVCICSTSHHDLSLPLTGDLLHPTTLGKVVTDFIKNYTVEMTLILLRLITYQRASHEGSTICRRQKPKTCKHWKVQKQGLLQ